MSKDKQMHLEAGFLISLLGCLININYGLPLAVLAGALKELYDFFNQDKHSVEFADFAFTVCGGAIAYMLFLGYILFIA